MTVGTTTNKISYAGNGATTLWSFPFACEDPTTIQVFITDSSGNVTQLGTSLYSVSLNAAIAPDPTPIGGSVTYPLTGSPLALGNTLTILRTSPLTQTTSLSNQGTLWQPVIEAAIDNQTLLIQQLNELLGRQITVAVSDPAPAPLPGVAQRKNQFAAFDGSGNLVPALASPGTAPISAAMQPVVAASTLALARTAMGLGTAATESIGAGLVDVSGALNTVSPITTDGINKAVIASFNGNSRVATAAITYTNPAANTLFNGFGFFIYANGGAVTVAINGADSFAGMSAGVSLVISQGQQVFISTDGTNTWYVRALRSIGYDAPVNFGLVASVASNILTVALKDENGNDPSASSPVLARFRDTTLASGATLPMAVTTALSIVVPNGATLGTTSGITHKLWIVLFNNAGSPSLGIINCRTSQAITPLNEAALISPTQISAGAATAGVFYSTSSGIVNKTFRILGYLEISEATAGTWATGPVRVQPFGPTIPLPGNVIQRLFGQISSATSITGPNVQTALNATINIQSAASFIHVQVIGGNVGLANSGNVVLFLSRGAGPTGFGSVANLVEPAIGGGSWGFSLSGMDIPGVTGNQAYFLYGSSSVGTNTFNINTTLQTIEVTEIAT